MARERDRRYAVHVGYGWMRLMVPYQIAYNPISAIVALYILELHGSVIDVAYAAAFANLVIIPSSIFWGELVEKYHRRRFFINLSFAGLGLALLGLYFSTTVLEVILLYGFVSFAIMANATPLNLLVMETEPKSRWAAGFSKLQVFSSLGSLLSLILAAVLAYEFSIRLLILALAPFTALAILLTLSITEPRTLKIKHSLVSTMHSFRSRLLSHRIYFPHIEHRNMGRRIAGAGSGLMAKGYFQMLLVAILVLYLATGLFNTSYTPGLRSVGLSNFDVFVIFAIANSASMTAFFSLGTFMAKITRMRTLVDSLLTRGFGYILIAAAFIAISGGLLMWMNAITYMFTSGIAYALFYTTTSTLIFKAVGEYNKSYKLGVYSGVMGAGTLAGSFLSGYISFFAGYWFTFALAGALTIFAAYLFVRAARAGAPRDEI